MNHDPGETCEEGASRLENLVEDIVVFTFLIAAIAFSIYTVCHG